LTTPIYEEMLWRCLFSLSYHYFSKVLRSRFGPLQIFAPTPVLKSHLAVIYANQLCPGWISSENPLSRRSRNLSKILNAIKL
jgi:hypothetical protein